MTTNRVCVSRLLILMLSLSACASPAHAADAADPVAAGTQRERNGGGIQASSWQPKEQAGVKNTGMVAFQGWFERGLDLHLAWLNTLGYWRRTSTWSDVTFTGTTNHELQTHLVPTLTALRVYPFTTPSDRVEPWLSGGAGVVLGFEQDKTTGTITSPNSGYQMHTGLGLRAGVGVDLRASDAFGVVVGGHFESASFGEEKPGERLYKGFGFDAGLTYRFQYR